MHEIRIAEDLEGGCHFNSNSSLKALDIFDLDNLDVLSVENVGNLICLSPFDLGETFKLAVVNTTEGDDKPTKYLMLFREAKGVTQFPKGAYPEAIF